MPAFRYVQGRDLWERQTGEPAEAFDWFQHWLNDGHRRSYVRTAEAFEVARDKVAKVARRNHWTERREAWKRRQSAQVQERFSDMVEQSLVPFAQAMARLSLHAAQQAPVEDVSADKALVAATGAMRVVKEPSVRELIQLASADDGAREFNVVDVVLNRLERDHPEAARAALDAIDQAGEPDPDSAPPASDGDGG